MAATFAQIEAQKAETIALADGWSAARLRFRPAPDSWSTAEMLDHMVKVEEGIVAHVRRGLTNPHRIGLRDRLGVLFIDRLFRSDRRVKTPASAKQALPDSEPDLMRVLQRWDESRRELAELLGHATAEQCRAGVFRHPVGGWMSLPQVLDFLSVHILHHGFQFARLREASNGL